MRILVVTTLAITVNSFLLPHIAMMTEEGNTVDIACNIDQPLRAEFDQMGCVQHALPFSRDPFSADNRQACKMLKKLVAERNYDIVHCHTPNAAAITRLACRSSRKHGLKVFYTAHGFHFYKGAPLKNWLVYYPVEWLCSFWTDTLITINSEDYQRAKKHLHAKRTEYVPGVGIDLKRFQKIGIDRSKKRRQIGVPADCTLLLSVGELNENKNHETVIRAIAGMDVFYIIAGTGGKADFLRDVAAKVGMEDRVKLMGFRTDVGELCECSDAFVFPSFREGLSVSLMEAMAKGLPIACSRIRGNVDLIDENGGALFNPTDIQACREAIKKVLQIEKARAFQHNTKKIEQFSTDIVVSRMKALYESS